MPQNDNLTAEYQSFKTGEVNCNYLDFVIPGVMFLLYGLWWVLQLTRVYYHTRWKHLDFHSSLVYPCSKQGCRQSVQSWIQLILILSALSVVMTSSRHPDSQGKTNMQMLRTCIILSAFGVSCLVNISAQFFCKQCPAGPRLLLLPVCVCRWGNPVRPLRVWRYRVADVGCWKSSHLLRDSNGYCYGFRTALSGSRRFSVLAGVHHRNTRHVDLPHGAHLLFTKPMGNDYGQHRGCIDLFCGSQYDGLYYGLYNLVGCLSVGARWPLPVLAC